MSLKGEKPITSYFPRLSPYSTVKTPTQSPPKLAKRARQPDEVDLVQEKSRKKTKNKNQKITENRDPLSSSAICSRSKSVDRPKKQPNAVVIEVQDSPPNTPTNPRIVRSPTPPSSPLPDLTPSPELLLRTWSPLHLSGTDGPVEDAELRQSDSPLIGTIPSSQTQELFTESYEDESEIFRAPAHVPSDIPLGSSELNAPSRASSCILSSHATSSGPYTFPDELIASSQSQLLESGQPSPISSDFEFVLSSQSQEFSYSQTIAYQSYRGTGEQRESILNVCITELPTSNHSLLVNGSQEFQDSVMADGGFRHSITLPSSQTQPESVIDEIGPDLPSPILSSQTQPESVIDEDESHFPRVIPHSHISPRPSRHSSIEYDGIHPPPTQPSQDHRSDGADSYESLPAVVKDFQSMFGETFESLPPDFPMSLRF